MRLDKYLFVNNFYESREKASIAIKKGLVMVDNKIVYKPSLEVIDPKIDIVDELLKYVSFGGNKLERAIEYFKLDFKDKVVLDIGSSTGGFTDCALQFGAKLVYAVDVGTNQLHAKLRSDPRVLVYENTNILDFVTDTSFDYLVCDISFVSIKKILAYVKRFFSPNTKMVCLIKPQFEVGDIYIKNGVVKDPKLHIEVLEDVLSFCNSASYNVLDLTYSTQLGKKGNIEYLVLLSTTGENKTFDIKKLVLESHQLK